MLQWALSTALLLTAATDNGGSWVEAVGEATIRDGDVAEARKTARADALRRCVEKVVGVAIESRFASEASSVTSGDKSRFSQRVRDELSQRSEGFIERSEVIHEDREGDTIRIRVRARVFESKLKAEITTLMTIAARAGNPRVAMIIHESVRDPDGKETVAVQSQFGKFLEQALIARGLELVTVSGAAKLTSKPRSAFLTWLDNAAGVASFARDVGADVVIVGGIQLHNDGVITQGAVLKALEGQTRMRLTGSVRAITIADARVVSSKALELKSFGVSFERAVYRALQGRGNNAVKQSVETLISDLIRAFKAMASDADFVVELRGVKSFRKQAAPFMDALKAVADVTKVEQQSFAEGTLKLNVACSCSIAELQARIFESVGSVKSLESLDVQSTDAESLVLKL